MNPTQIKQPRLSEESTTESSTSVSGDSEADRQTDDDSAGSVSAIGPWSTEEEFMAHIMTIPEIAGRYTEADPAFREDVESVTPPILENYAPRKHDRDRPPGGGGGGGGGGRQYSGYHNQHQQGQSQHRGYSNHRNDYRDRNRYGERSHPYHRNNPRPTSSGGEGRGGEGRGRDGGDGGNQYNRYQDNRGDSWGRGDSRGRGDSGGRGDNRGDGRGDGGPRGQKRKSDHSHSFEPSSQFYARPIGNKTSRLSNSDEDEA